jgi:hypothetical protein
MGRREEGVDKRTREKEKKWIKKRKGSLVGGRKLGEKCSEG